MTAPRKRGRPRVGEGSKQTAIRFDDELMSALRKSAERSGHSLSVEIRQRLWIGLATKLDSSYAKEIVITDGAWTR